MACHCCGIAGPRIFYVAINCARNPLKSLGLSFKAAIAAGSEVGNARQPKVARREGFRRVALPINRKYIVIVYPSQIVQQYLLPILLSDTSL